MTDPTPVVTCFLRHDAEVLLVRRAPDASTYPERWGAISGYVEGDDPGATAVMEVREETGRTDPALVRAGEPFVVEDAGRAFRVHPFLFDVSDRSVALNEEATAAEWAPPTAILRREAVPELWRSYDRVRPTPGTIAADEEHGAAELSIRALEVLRDTAGHAAARDDPMAAVRTVATDLLAARPSMAVLANRVNRAMTDVSTPAAVERAAIAGIERALRADRAAAATAAETLPPGPVLTLSRSGTVLRALEGLDRPVIVAESHPGREGVGVAEALARDGRAVTLCPDAAVAYVLAEREVGAVLVGADTVLPDGRVVNKVGTRGAAIAAAHEGVPVYVAAATDKVSPDGGATLEPAPADAVYDGDAALDVTNPRFDVTPAEVVTAFCTERGAIDPDAIAGLADELRDLAGWRD